jgi:pathogenesis-related protein 1
MRCTLWLLLALAEIAGAQWRHFGPDAAGTAESSFARDILAAHNSERARVGVASLIWSDRLAKISYDWAADLLARRQFRHSPNSSFGENLFEITGASASTAQVVDVWARESRTYNYASNKCRGVCGHYTQIVWSATKEVGCAVARGGGREVWVCTYDPPGNVIGQRPY